MCGDCRWFAEMTSRTASEAYADRTAAVKAYVQSGADIKAAKAIFRQLRPRDNISRLDRFIRKWSSAFEKKGSVSDNGRSGRRLKIDDTTAAQLSAVFKAGYVCAAQTVHYTSVAQARQSNAAFKALLGPLKVGNRTVLAAMKRSDSGLCRRIVTIKKAFNAAEMRTRVSIANQCLSIPDAHRLRCVYIDAKKLYLVPPKTMKVYMDKADADMDTVLEVPQMSKPACLTFYIAVNAILGPVALVFTSGTTDFTTKKVYTVRQQLSYSTCYTCLICCV